MMLRGGRGSTAVISLVQKNVLWMEECPKLIAYLLSLRMSRSREQHRLNHMEVQRSNRSLWRAIATEISFRSLYEFLFHWLSSSKIIAGRITRANTVSRCATVFVVFCRRLTLGQLFEQFRWAARCFALLPPPLARLSARREPVILNSHNSRLF